MDGIAPELIKKLQSLYDNKVENLKFVTAELKRNGLGNMEIVQFIRKELKVSLKDVLYYGKIPDYLGD